MARLCSDQILAPLDHLRQVAGLCMLYKVNYNSIHCLYGELPSASQGVRRTRAAVAAHRFEVDDLRCRTSKFASLVMPDYVLVGMST